MKDLIEVNNIFAAVFGKSVLDPLLAVIRHLQPSRPALELRFWGTEGTMDYVRDKGFSAQSVVYGFDYDGRVKSLDHKVFAAILADKSKQKHLLELKKEKIEPMDLVIVDLYAPDPSIFPESMDIGGQSLVRAAIKNFKNVALAFNEESIEKLVLELNKNALMTSLTFRRQQAKAAAKFIASRTKLEVEMFDKV